MRYARRVLAYRTLLVKAGFTSNNKPFTTGLGSKSLFNKDLLQAMEDNGGPEFTSAAQAFRKRNPSWGQLVQAFQALDKFIETGTGGGTDEYRTFENAYIRKSSSGVWADGDLKAILEMIARPNGAQLIGQARPQHAPRTSKDYADDIYDELVDGKLVIVDQSSGNEVVNRASAERIIRRIFDGNKGGFPGRTL